MTIYGAYVGGTANVRSGPGTSFPVVGGLDYRAPVEARLVIDLDWYRIDAHHFVGASVVSTTLPPAAPTPSKTSASTAGSSQDNSSTATGSTSKPATATSKETVSVPSPRVITADVLAQVNELRAAAGVGPVAAQSCASTAALAHSKDQAARDSMFHSSMEQLLAVCHGSVIGENVGIGYSKPATVVAAWFKSAGHRQNLLNPSFTAMGVAVAYSANGTPYYTQVFLAS